MDNRDHNKIIHSVSLDTYTDKKIVDTVIHAYYQMCKDAIESSDKEDAESFPRIIIPYIGSLIPNTSKIKKVKNIINAENQIRENQQEDRRD